MDRILFLCVCGVFLLLPFIHSYSLSKEEDLNDIDSEIEALVAKRQTGDGDLTCEDVCDEFETDEDFTACVLACSYDETMPEKRIFGGVSRFVRRVGNAAGGIVRRVGGTVRRIIPPVIRRVIPTRRFIPRIGWPFKK